MLNQFCWPFFVRKGFEIYKDLKSSRTTRASEFVPAPIAGKLGFCCGFLFAHLVWAVISVGWWIHINVQKQNLLCNVAATKKHLCHILQFTKLIFLQPCSKDTLLRIIPVTCLNDNKLLSFITQLLLRCHHPALWQVFLPILSSFRYSRMTKLDYLFFVAHQLSQLCVTLSKIWRPNLRRKHKSLCVSTEFCFLFLEEQFRLSVQWSGKQTKAAKNNCVLMQLWNKTKTQSSCFSFGGGGGFERELRPQIHNLSLSAHLWHNDGKLMWSAADYSNPWMVIHLSPACSMWFWLRQPPVVRTSK